MPRVAALHPIVAQSVCSEHTDEQVVDDVQAHSHVSDGNAEFLQLLDDWHLQATAVEAEKDECHVLQRPRPPHRGRRDAG